MENLLPFPHENDIYLIDPLHGLSDACAKTILPHLRSNQRSVPTLCSLCSCSSSHHDHPQIVPALRTGMELQYMAGGLRHPSPAVHDKQAKGH